MSAPDNVYYTAAEYAETENYHSGCIGGVILNKEVMAKLRVKKGDSLYLTEAPGGYRLTPIARSSSGR